MHVALASLRTILALSPAILPEDRTAQLLAENLARISQVWGEFSRIPLDQTCEPYILAHSVLVNGAEAKIGSAEDAPSAVDVLLHSPSAVEQTAEGIAFRFSLAARTTQRHPSQYVCYCLQSGLTLRDYPRLAELWETEKRLCHSEMDVAWFIPAFCLTGGGTFHNKYGEAVSAEYLVLALLQQRKATSPSEQPCGGMHVLQAMSYSAKYLSKQLSAPVRQQLITTWERDRKRVLQLIDIGGQLDLHALLQLEASKQIADSLYVQVAGHCLESLLICDSPIEGDDSDRIDRYVRHLLDCIERSHFLKDADALKSSDPQVLPTYGEIAHLIHGLRLYAAQAPNWRRDLNR